jgi:flagellar FliJ protein
MKSLLVLLKKAEEERDRCLAASQAAQASHVAAVAQHDQLLSYRRDYEQRWQGQFGQQGQMELVRCYHGFMLRLSQAVEHQQAAVQQAAARLEAALAVLRDREVRVASVRKLIERRRQRAHTEHERREQKQTDERGARIVPDSAFPSGMVSLY